MKTTPLQQRGRGRGRWGLQRERKVICRPWPWRETREAGAGAGEWAKVATAGSQARRVSLSVSVSAPIREPCSQPARPNTRQEQEIRPVLGRMALTQREGHTRSRGRTGEGQLGSRNHQSRPAAAGTLCAFGWGRAGVLPWQPNDPAPASARGGGGCRLVTAQAAAGAFP